jgi:hypothetical protein
MKDIQAAPQGGKICLSASVSPLEAKSSSGWPKGSTGATPCLLPSPVALRSAGSNENEAATQRRRRVSFPEDA